MITFHGRGLDLLWGNNTLLAYLLQMGFLVC
jgi:hypothetical protein